MYAAFRPVRALVTLWRTPVRLPAALVGRLHGPGGYYNVGNLLGLAVSLSLPVADAATGRAPSLGQAIGELFAGSPSAVALTVATLIFLVSGEVYHRAHRTGAAPDVHLNRLADLLSTAGAVALTVSLVFLGQPGLAVISGLAIALGKLGSAVFGDDRAGLIAWPPTWPDPFRILVLSGRTIGLAAVALTLLEHPSDPAGHAVSRSMLQAATLAICHIVWLRADFLLLCGARSVTASLAAEPAE
jgi:hypothetical protein